MPAIVRARRPTLFLAYGEAGGRWLSMAASRCRDDDKLRRLVDRGVIQFWCIGSESVLEPVRGITTVPAASVLADLLTTARSVQATAEFAELQVREVLVLERLSLFDGASDSRPELVRSLVQASLVDLDLDKREQEFDYRWITLADAVRPAALPSEVIRDVAAAALAGAPSNESAFLVDRVNSDSANIDADYADAALQRLSFAFVAGDLGAPRADGSAVVLPDVVSRPQAGCFVPFNVAELEHKMSVIEEGQLYALRRSLADGLIDLSRAQSILNRNASLTGAVSRDIEELSSGRLDLHHARSRREMAAQDLIAWALASGASTTARRTLSDVQRELLRIRPREADASAAAVFAVGSSMFSQDALVRGALAVALVALGYAAIRFMRRSKSHASDSSDSAPLGSGHAALAAEVRREWESLCKSLSLLLDEWDRIVASHRDEDPSPAWETSPPFAWALMRTPSHVGDRLPVTQDMCTEIAKMVVAEAERGASAEAAFDKSLRRLLRRLRTDANFVGGVVAAALDDATSSSIRSQVDRRPWLLRAERPIALEAVQWLTAPALEIESKVRTLEPSHNRDSLRVLTHDWLERSTRIAFGTPIGFRQVQSLNFLFERTSRETAQ